MFFVVPVTRFILLFLRSRFGSLVVGHISKARKDKGAASSAVGIPTNLATPAGVMSLGALTVKMITSPLRMSSQTQNSSLLDNIRKHPPH